MVYGYYLKNRWEQTLEKIQEITAHSLTYNILLAPLIIYDAIWDASMGEWLLQVQLHCLKISVGRSLAIRMSMKLSKG